MVTSSMLLRIDATSTARGFEPLRAEPNGFLVHHLNHSVTLSCHILLASYACRLKFIAGLVSLCCKEFVGSSKILQKQASALRLSWVHSSVVRAADCRSAGPWFKSGCALLFIGPPPPACSVSFANGLHSKLTSATPAGLQLVTKVSRVCLFYFVLQLQETDSFCTKNHSRKPITGCCCGLRFACK